MGRRNPEQDLQRSVVGFLRAALPPPPHGPFWFAPDAGVQAGGRQARIVGGIRQGLGVRAGVPDIVFLGAKPFCIELKSPKGQPSDQQRAVMAQLSTLGINTYVVRSLDELETALEAEGVPMHGRISA